MKQPRTIMATGRLSFIEAKQIPVIDYLASLGFEPAMVRGEDHWYHSPFREERTPSFKVNTKLNVWYDHGTGEGGTILDLGAKLNQCSLVEFLQKLTDGEHHLSFHRQTAIAIKPENTLEVISVQELRNPDLLHYLGTRKISGAMAAAFCKEIDFRIRDRVYKAIGFPNGSGGWELRNSWFKGSSSPKDVSAFNNGFAKISVLEGFMDFLSLQQVEQKEMQAIRNNSDFLVLNSLRLLNRAIPLIQSYKDVNLFLDNDLAAREAKENLKGLGIQYNDASSMYSKHKDVSEFLAATHKKKLSRGFSKVRPRKLGQ